MRIPAFVAVLLLHAAASLAHAGNDPIASRVGYLPAPNAMAPGRPAVVKRLRQLGKEELQNAKENAEYDCESSFDAKVLLDTPVLYSLDTTGSWICPGRSTQGGRAPLLFEMGSGREYDIGRLYRVRDRSGALVAPLRAKVARRMSVEEAGMSAAEVAEAVENDLSRERPHLFVTKTGIMAWPQGSLVWLDEVVLTWAELRPYLNAAEAQRLGWTH